MAKTSKTLPARDISSFCMSLYLAFKAGIPLDEGAELCADESAIRPELAKKLAAELRKGKSLAEALRETGVFPKYMSDMVGVGEKTGRLDDTLFSMSRHYERQDEIAREVSSAVAYPIMLLVALLVAFVIFAVLLLPIFNDVYGQLGAVMPRSATSVMKFGELLVDYWIPIVIVIAVLAVIAVIFRRALAGVIKNFANRRHIGKLMTSAKLSSLLTMMLASGLTSDEALHVSSEVVEDKDMSRQIAESADKAIEGTPLSDCVESLGLFPKMYVKMLQIGERTGTAVEALEEITRRTSNTASDRLAALIGRIEPVLVIIMSVLIGVLLMSIMLPLTGVMSLI